MFDDSFSLNATQTILKILIKLPKSYRETAFVDTITEMKDLEKHFCPTLVLIRAIEV